MKIMVKAVNYLKEDILSVVYKKRWFITSFILIIAAGVRYFFKLNAWPSFHDDEFQTIAAAYGYLKTGTYYQWDFANECITKAYYNRAWPYTILLANWMRLGSISEVSCRALSALLGLIFIISCIYISKKLFENIMITFISVIIILANPEITMFFRYTRMYALVMPVCLWMMYFAYRALTEKNNIKNEKNKVLLFIKHNLDFHIGYAGLAIFLCYFSLQIHINSAILCLGILLFSFYKMCVTKEKKYIIVTTIFSVIIIGLFIGMFFYESIRGIPLYGYIVGALLNQGGFLENIHLEYLSFILSEFGSKGLAVLFIIMYLVALFRTLKLRKINQADGMIYLGSIFLTTVLFFCYFTNRYYSGHYIMMLLPISAMVYAVGFLICYQYKKIIAIVISAFLCFSVYQNIRNNYDSVYTASDKSDFIPAYEKMAEYYDLQTETVPILALFPRIYYLSQVVKHYEIGGLNRENDMDVLVEFSAKYPEGIIACESGKVFGLQQGMEEFIIKYSDHLSGEGIDDYNVEVSHYHFLDGLKIEDIPQGIEKYDVFWDKDKKNAKIIVDLSEFEKNVEVLCIRINISSLNGEKVERAFQLKLPEMKNGYYQYILEEDFFDKYTIDRVGIENNYAVYGMGMLEEFDKFK